jgi:hypothetical protein
MGQRVFQIDKNEDVYVAADLEMIYMSEVQDHNNIIIDTGSAYNLIGHHLVPILKQRIINAGSEMSIIPTKKTFQFGGRTVANSSTKLLVPITIGPNKLQAEVYVVDTEIPFLIGGGLLRENKTEISVNNNTMKINNHKVDLILLNSGHIALNWDENLHKTRSPDVFLTQKVPQKEWNNPQVVEAMEKEIGNLQENGTYKEVQKEPWMVVIPSMWVINQTTDDDGKNAGKIKARLVVRGDQDKAEDDIPCDSPTVDRNTAKLLIAIAAIMGWSLRSVDISAAFLQG